MNNQRDFLRILITNAHLSGYSGGETYVRDLASKLFELGHTPIVHTREAGPIFDELRQRGISATTDLCNLGDAPDVILGNTQEETVLALLQFPQTPAVFVCHARIAWLALAPRMTRIRQYVAVDANCYDGLTCEQGISPTQTKILLNAVDMERFCRRAPLPERPKTAAVFSNYALPEGYAEVIRSECSRRGISFEVVGEGYGTRTASPQQELARFDIVFAKARCAQEALAVGCAVVLCDTLGLGPMVTLTSVDELWRSNLGWRLLREPITPDAIAARIGEFDAVDAGKVSDHVRKTARIERLAEHWIETLREAIQIHHAAPAIAASVELAEVAAYIRSVALHGTYHQLYASMLAADRARIEQSSRSDRVSRAYIELESQLRAVQGALAQTQGKMKQLELERSAAIGQRGASITELGLIFRRVSFQIMRTLRWIQRTLLRRGA